MRNKPRIRFKGFTEDWEQRKLSDILKVNSGKDYKHLDQGNIPVYGTGGYMLSVNESLSNIDAIGIGRKGTIDKPQYLKAPFWTVDTLFYLTALDKHSILFLYYLMQLIPWKKFDESTGVPSLSKTTIDNISGFVPSNSQEEELISALFNQLDKSITLHQRKLEKLKLAKKALLQKLFPKNGSQFPEIRFKGFTDAWEQRKLISLYKTIRNAFVGTATPYYTNDSINGYFYLESNNVKNGKINRNNEIYITKDFYQKQEDKLLYKDDIVIVQSGHVGHTAVIPEELDKTAAHALIMLQNKKENFDSHFINNSFQTPLIRNKIDEITTGNTIKHILASDVKTIVINMPSFKEQKLISQLFKLLDLNITLHQRKLERLQEVKIGLLQKMFV